MQRTNQPSHTGTPHRHTQHKFPECSTTSTRSNCMIYSLIGFFSFPKSLNMCWEAKLLFTNLLFHPGARGFIFPIDSSHVGRKLSLLVTTTSFAAVRRPLLCRVALHLRYSLQIPHTRDIHNQELAPRSPLPPQADWMCIRNSMLSRRRRSSPLCCHHQAKSNCPGPRIRRGTLILFHGSPRRRLTAVQTVVRSIDSTPREGPPPCAVTYVFPNSI